MQGLFVIRFEGEFALVELVYLLLFAFFVNYLAVLGLQNLLCVFLCSLAKWYSTFYHVSRAYKW